MNSPTTLSDSSPIIRTVLPHLLATNSVWTTELELELLEFAELCEDYATQCEYDAVTKHRLNTGFRITSMFCAGSAAIFPHFEHIGVETAGGIVTGVSMLSLAANVIQSVCSFEKSASIERSASVLLREVSKEIRLEISKPLLLRWQDPYERLLTLEGKFSETIQKISPKMVDNDIKSKIKSARRARMRSRQTPS